MENHLRSWVFFGASHKHSKNSKTLNEINFSLKVIIVAVVK